MVFEVGDCTLMDKYDDGSFLSFHIATFQSQNYTGTMLAAVLEEEMNAATALSFYKYKVYIK